jgi:hypothetical protein
MADVDKQKDVAPKTDDTSKASEALLKDSTCKTDATQKGCPTGDNQNAITTDIDKALTVFAKLPKDIELRSNDFPKIAEALTGEKLGPQVEGLLKGVTSIEKHDNHIELKRDTTAKLELNQNIGASATVKSLDVGSVSFDISTDKGNVEISNLKGISVSMSALGIDKSVDIKSVAMTKDKDGNPVLSAEVENPFPKAAQIMLDLPPTIPVSVTIGPDGKPFVKASQALDTAASSTGYSLPGLLLGGSLREAQMVSKLAEDHPEALKTAAALTMPIPYAAISLAQQHPDAAKAIAETIIDTTVPGAAALRFALEHPELAKQAAVTTADVVAPGTTAAIRLAADHPEAAKTAAIIAAEVAVPGSTAIISAAAANPEAAKEAALTTAEVLVPGVAVARVAAEHPEAVKQVAKAALYTSPVGGAVALWDWLSK